MFCFQCEGELVEVEDGLFTLIALGLSLFLVPLVRSLAVKYNVMDQVGDPLKIHEKPIPYMGGVAFGTAFLTTMASLFTIRGYWTPTLIVGLGSAFGVALLGLLDDVHGLKPGARLMVQLLVGLILSIFGVRINFMSNVVFGTGLTMVFVAGMINAVNMFDGLDGLAGGVVALSALGFSLVFGTNGSLYAMVAVSLIAVLLGFLVFNFNPAKIFMGDAGSYFLGLVLALFAIELLQGAWDVRAVFGTVFLLGMPLIDSLVTVLTRLYGGFSPTSGDRNHLYDRLNQRLGSVRRTVVCFYGLQACSVAIGVWLHLG